jgi:hypothetical protein
VDEKPTGLLRTQGAGHWRDEHFIWSIMFRQQVGRSLSFGKCPKDVRGAIKKEKVGSVTKVDTIEKLLDDQLTVNH